MAGGRCDRWPPWGAWGSSLRPKGRRSFLGRETLSHWLCIGSSFRSSKCRGEWRERGYGPCSTADKVMEDRRVWNVARSQTAWRRQGMGMEGSRPCFLPKEAPGSSLSASDGRMHSYRRYWLSRRRLPPLPTWHPTARLCGPEKTQGMGRSAGRVRVFTRCRCRRSPTWTSRYPTADLRSPSTFTRVQTCGNPQRFRRSSNRSSGPQPYRAWPEIHPPKPTLRTGRTGRDFPCSSGTTYGAGRVRKEEGTQEAVIQQHGGDSTCSGGEARSACGEEGLEQEEEEVKRTRPFAKSPKEEKERHDYKQLAEWFKQLEFRQAPSPPAEESGTEARLSTLNDGGARDRGTSPSSCRGVRRSSGLNDKVHDLLSDTGEAPSPVQGTRSAGARDVSQRTRHVTRRTIRGVGRPSKWKVRGRRECGADRQLEQCAVFGSGSAKAARDCTDAAPAGCAKAQPRSRKGLWSRFMVNKKDRWLGKQLQELQRGNRKSRKRKRRQKQRQKQERKEGSLEREAKRSRGGAPEIELRRRLADPLVQGTAERAVALEAALAEQTASVDPYGGYEEFTEEPLDSARLKAAFEAMQESLDDELRSEAQEDPYFFPAEDRGLCSTPILSADPTLVVERLEQYSPGLRCSSFEELGLWLTQGCAPAAPGRMLEAFAELLAPCASGAEAVGSRRWRLFPLPVDLSRCSQAPGLRRSEDLSVEVWTNLALAGLNSLAGEKGPYPKSRESKQVGRVVDSVRDRVSRFLEGSRAETLEPEKLWEDLISKRIGYEGEEVMEPVPLSFKQILKSVPPIGHGGSVPVAPLLEGTTRWLIEHPEECLLPPSARQEGPNCAAVHIIPGDELAVWRLLEQRGIIEWLPKEAVHRDERGPFLSGLFGVAKAGRFDEEGNQILRVIMNLKPVNRIMRTLVGDVGELPMAPVWCQLQLSPHEEMRFSQGDMQAAFYLFLMPPMWRPYFAFNSSFSCEALQRPGTGDLVPVCRVLPMGWTSSVGVMQMMSRRLLRDSQLMGEVEVRRKALTPPWYVEECLRRGQERWWQVYLDNFFTAEIRDRNADEGKLDELHQTAMNTWDANGVLNVPEKHVIGAREVVELGVRSTGDQGLVGASPLRVRKLIVVTLLLLQRKFPKRRWAQVILGRWIFVLQFKRQGMAVLSRCWQYIRTTEDKRRWWPVVQKELATLVLLSPLLQTDIFTTFHPLATCSDASETGGAVAVSEGLTMAGQDVANRLRERATSPTLAPILVLSLFNGIGGAFRCFDLAGIEPLALVSVECDPAARRVTRRAWPHAIEIDDVRKVNKEMLRDWANQFPRLTHVFVLAGFPCVHLSSARAGRKNLEGEGSNLFWELVRILGEAEEVFQPMVKVEFVVENVASMDVSARDEMSRTLDVEPVMVCPSDCLPYNRPRLAWVSAELESTAGVTFERREGFVRVHMEGGSLHDDEWVDAGWWRCDPACQLPTFMKSIARRSPPTMPAGISRCNDADLARWASDDYRFPPYQYQRRYLFTNEEGALRYSSIREREKLLGFGCNHVAFCFSASVAKQRPQEFLDKQYSLLGDTFSMLSFAWIVSQLGKKWVNPLTPLQVVRRMGLAPGAGLATGLEAPISTGLRYGAHQFPSRGPDSTALTSCQPYRERRFSGIEYALQYKRPRSCIPSGYLVAVANRVHHPLETSLSY